MKKKSIAKATKPLGPQGRGSMPIDDTHEDIDTLKKDETSVALDFDDHSRTKRTSTRKLFALTKKEGRSDASKRPSSSMKTPPSSQDGEEKIHTRKFLHDTSSQPDLKLPPSSIVEAQEYGEKNRFQDQVAWALQCVAEQGNTRYQALTTLLSLFGNKRSRNVPHIMVLSLEVVPLLSDLDVIEDSLVAIAVATLLFISSQAPDGKQSFLSSEKTMVLIENLLQASAVPQEGRGNPLALAVNRIFRDIDFARLIPRETHFSPVDICLATLCYALAPNACPPATLEVKVALRQAGVLRHIVRIVLFESAALTEQQPTMATVQSIWRLHRSLSVLEFCCFACPENEKFFSKLEVSQGCEPYVTSMKLSNWLLLQIHNLSNQALIEGMKKDCLGSLLAVLMNITQNNEDVLTVVPISSLKILTGFLSNICLGGRMCPLGVVHNIEVLYTWVDELNACLGVLINLVASNADIRGELRQARVSANGADRSLVFLLSRLIVKVRTAFGGQAGRPGQKDVQNEDSQEVTLDILREGEGEATAATVESYAAILLGLLVKDSASARLEAQQIFSNVSMEPIIDAIQRCLVFYLRAGALTVQMENILKELVVALRNQLV